MTKFDKLFLKIFFKCLDWLWYKTIGKLGKFKNRTTFEKMCADNKKFYKKFNCKLDYWEYETADPDYPDDPDKYAVYRIYVRGVNEDKVFRVE